MRMKKADMLNQLVKKRIISAKKACSAVKGPKEGGWSVDQVKTMLLKAQKAETMRELKTPVETVDHVQYGDGNTTINSYSQRDEMNEENLNAVYDEEERTDMSSEQPSADMTYSGKVNWMTQNSRYVNGWLNVGEAGIKHPALPDETLEGDRGIPFKFECKDSVEAAVVQKLINNAKGLVTLSANKTFFDDYTKKDGKAYSKVGIAMEGYEAISQAEAIMTYDTSEVRKFGEFCTE